jgi:hypothetical protein
VDTSETSIKPPQSKKASTLVKGGLLGVSWPIDGGRLGDEQQDGCGRAGRQASVRDSDIEASREGLVLSGKLHHLEGEQVRANPVVASSSAKLALDEQLLNRTIRKALEKGGDFAEVYVEKRISRAGLPDVPETHPYSAVNSRRFGR